MVDVVTELAREDALSEFLYADDLVLMSETIKGLWNKFLKWKEDFERKGLKVNLRITKVMVSSSITKDDMSKSKVHPCGFCSLRAKANSILCVQCGKWIHGRCVGVKRVIPKFSRNIKCKKCEWNIGEAVEQGVKLRDEVETEFSYLGDRVRAGGGCEAVVTARKRCAWVKFMECGELLHGRFPRKLKGLSIRVM